jgi:putative transposase
MQIVHGSHCVFDLNFHLVLVTKYRHRCLAPEMAVRIDGIVRSILERHGGNLVAANGEPDHRHFLFACPPAVRLSSLVCAIKTATSRLIRKEFAKQLRPYYWKPVLWSRSYCLASAGGAPLEIIQQYIQNQGGA